MRINYFLISVLRRLKCILPIFGARWTVVMSGFVGGINYLGAKNEWEFARFLIYIEIFMTGIESFKKSL